MSSDFEPMEYRDTFFLFFDILGFKKMVDNSVAAGAAFFQLELYLKETIREFKESLRFDDGVVKGHHWFSDSFIIWSFDDSPRACHSLMFLGGYFVKWCINHHVPLRGAMSFGKFYIDDSKRTFFGPALIEAYTYSEAQEWIGFSVLPSALEQLTKKDESFLERPPFGFSKNIAPFTKKDGKGKLIRPVGDTWSFNFYHRGNFEPHELERLKSMRSKSPTEAHQKYDNTIALIHKNYVPLEPHK